MPSTTTDAQLVAEHLLGDRAAFAAIYDRYGDTLYDTAAAMTRDRDDAADITQDVFVVAAERMSQLRDPTRLKPWLFAILRNEVYRRSGKRKRVVLTDFTDPAAEVAVPPQPADETADLEYQELAELVRGAALGLDERDQLVLEYSIRQGLQGDDLADALGVSAQQSYGLLHRMRQRTERSLGAYCVARTGRTECDELAEILRGWDGEFTVLIRKRVARHIDRCEICERSRRKLAPLALFGAAPAFAAPAGLRDRVLGTTGRGAEPDYGFGAPGGFPTALRQARRLGVWIVLMTGALLFVGSTAVWVLAADDQNLAIDDGSTTTTEDSPTTAAGPMTVADPLDDPVDDIVADTAADATTTTSGATTAPSTTSTTSSTSSTTSTLPIVVTLPPTTAGTTTNTTATTTAAATPAPTTAPTPSPTTAPTTAAPTTSTASIAPTTTPPPGVLSLSTGAIDFGTTRDQAVVTLANTGGQAVEWSTLTGPVGFRGASSPYSATPAGGKLAPGATIEVIIGIDRTWPVEGPLATERLTFAGSGTSSAVDLDGTIARPPVVEVRLPGPTHCPIVAGAGNNPLVASAVVSDESPPLDVLWRIVGPNGSRSLPMTPGRSEWRAAVVLDFDGDQRPDVGPYTWSITATDAFGNSTTEAGETEVQTRYCQ